MINIIEKKTISNFHLLVKPAGALCNLNCRYCFYLPKEDIYQGSSFYMSGKMMKKYISQLIDSHKTREVNLSWQGGEPTIMGLDYFRKAVKYAEQYKKPGQKMVYTLQTNGTLLDNEWCAFLKENKFLVGLSMDGPEEIHNTYRIDKLGKGTFSKVIHAYELLIKHNVEVNIMCAVHAANEYRSLDVYRFFRDTLGASFLQFIPIVENVECQSELSKSANKKSVNAEQFGQFMIEIFNEWMDGDIGKIFVQSFDVALGNLTGQHTLCMHAPECGRSLVLEHNGDMYSCDHFVNQKNLLGNISKIHMAEMAGSDEQRKFGKEKNELLPKQCRSCDVFTMCYGGCPKDRIIKTSDGEAHLNYLCAGYRNFFHYITPHLKEMTMYM